jgi:hypothetical protein
MIENQRSRAMFLCLLLGGLTVALTIGLLDVLSSTPMPSRPRAR